MILQSESGLTTEQYQQMVAAFGDPVANVVLEQYSLSLTEKEGGGSGSANHSFDAIVVNDVVVRVWATTDTITVEALASEDDSDQSWASQNLTATSVVAAAGLTLATSGDTVRVFWWDGTNIRYFESTDKGSSWGSSTVVYAKDDVHLIAATSLTKLHMFSETDEENYLLHVIEHDGSWGITDSDVYWPFLVGSFDAIAVSSSDDAAASSADVLAFTTDFPPMVQVSVENTSIARDYERVRGIAVMRYQNGRWAEHVSLDTVDNLYGESEREHVRLSNYDDLLFLTYSRIDGDEDYNHTSIAVSRSKTGIHWEQPYLLGDLVDAPATLMKRGAHAYLVNAEDTYRSPSVGYTGDSRVTQDITSRVVALTSRMGDIQEIQITLSNPNGILDGTSPLDDDVLMQAVIKEGWIVGGAELMIQTALVDIDSISQSLQIPTDHKIIVGRDVLARLMTCNADYVQEWQSQQVSGDNYQGPDNTKYSGLHHTAAVLGHWETGSNTLKLSSSKTPGVAFHTGVSNAWNGSVRAKCKVSPTDADDYVGVAFRAHDYENMWFCVYDADADKVKIVDRRLNVDSVALQSASMGWSFNTQYALQVDFRYNNISVYYSEDLVNFSFLMSHTPEGVSVPGASWGDIPIMAGAMGYVGHGFSETQTGEWPAPPEPPPWPTEPPVYPSTVTDWPNEVYLATWEMGVYYTANFTGPDDPDQPVWTAINAGLPQSYDGGDIRYYLRQFMVDPHNPRATQYCITGDNSVNGGDAIYRRRYGGLWEEILAAGDSPMFAQEKIFYICGNDNAGQDYHGHLYALCGERVYGGTINILMSTDYGTTWTSVYEKGVTGSFYRLANLYVDGIRIVFGWNGEGASGNVSITDISSEDVRTLSVGSSIFYPWVAHPRAGTYRNTVSVASNSYVITRIDLWNRLGSSFPPVWSNPDAIFGTPAIEIGPERPDSIYFSPHGTGEGYVLKNGELYRTLNNFINTNLTADLIEPDEFWAVSAPIEDEFDKIFLGRAESISIGQPGHIYCTDDYTDDSPVDKNGVDPDNDATTVSIPYTGNGVCWGGLQPLARI